MIGINSSRDTLTDSNLPAMPSLPCPIINAQNRNEAGIPALTRQDRPIEIVSLQPRFQGCIKTTLSFGWFTVF